VKSLIHTRLPDDGVMRHRLGRLPEKFAMWIAWRLPRAVCHWCAVRLFAHATQGEWSNEHPESVTVIDALRRWS
jgi:hypothetical protein